MWALKWHGLLLGNPHLQSETKIDHVILWSAKAPTDFKTPKSLKVTTMWLKNDLPDRKQSDLSRTEKWLKSDCLGHFQPKVTFELFLSPQGGSLCPSWEKSPWSHSPVISSPRRCGSTALRKCDVIQDKEIRTKILWCWKERSVTWGTWDTSPLHHVVLSSCNRALEHYWFGQLMDLLFPYKCRTREDLMQSVPKLHHQECLQSRGEQGTRCLQEFIRSKLVLVETNCVD